MSDQHAARAVEILWKYDKLFLTQMMVEELGIMPPDEDANPYKNGLVTFFAFVLCGSVPLWFYLIFWGAGWHNRKGMFGIACVATALALFGLGVVKARFTKQKAFYSGLGILINGALATACAYFVGWGLQVALDLQSNGQAG